jgi:hypothetical protein
LGNDIATDRTRFGQSRIYGLLALLLAAVASPAASADDAGLPPLPAIQALTEKALVQVRDGGFITWIADTKSCYASLKKHEGIQKRVYCLQLDSIAFAIESGQSETFRKLDLEASDYFTDKKFVSRQMEYTPPLGGRPDDRSLVARKLQNIKTLGGIEHIVIKEYIRRSGG